MFTGTRTTGCCWEALGGVSTWWNWKGCRGGPEPILTLARPSLPSQRRQEETSKLLSAGGERGFVGHKEAWDAGSFPASQSDPAGTRARLDTGEMIFEATAHRARLSGCSCISDLRSRSVRTGRASDIIRPVCTWHRDPHSNVADGHLASASTSQHPLF